MLLRLMVVLLLLAVSACASQVVKDESLGANATHSQVIEITAGSDGTYFWRGQYWPLDELRSALISADRTLPVVAIHLFGDELTVAHVIQVGTLAEALGAEAFYDDDGALKSITVTLD